MRAREYAPRVTISSASRASLVAGHRRALLSASFCALLGVAACSTYGEDLLVSAQGAADAGGAGAASSSVGGANNGASGNAGSTGSIGHGGTTGIAGTSSVGGKGDPTGGLAGESGEAGEAGRGENGGLSNGGTGEVGGSGGRASTGGTAPIGGTSGGISGSGGSTTTGGGGAAASTELIDDFEDGDGFINLTKKRNGPWYAFDDGTGGAAAVFKVAAETGVDALSGSTIGGHMTGSGFTAFGAGFGFDFVNMQAKKVPYDVSAYKGVRFYAKVESGSQAAIKVLMPTTYSDPMGGKCDDTVATKKCNDHLFVQKTLTTSWAQYQFEFADLVQQGFGLPQATLDPASVYSLQFTVPTTVLPANMWLDNVSFLLK